MTYRFGVFEFDPDAGGLRKNGRVVALEPQPAKALGLQCTPSRRWVMPTTASRPRRPNRRIAMRWSASMSTGPRDFFVVDVQNNSLGIDRPGGPARRGLGHTGNHVFSPTGVPAAKIAFAREGGKVTQMTLADPIVMLTAKRQ